MRNLHSKESFQIPTKISPFMQRSRLRSLKQLSRISNDIIEIENQYHQQRILEILQRKLVEENQKLENQQSFDSVNKNNSITKVSKHAEKQLSQKKLAILKQRNKLFQHFEQRYRKQIPAEKVQRQKVTFTQKIFGEIKTRIKTNQQINNIRINDLSLNLKKKYLELHSYQQKRNELEALLKKEIKHKTLQKMKMSRSSAQSSVKQQDESPQRKTIVINLRPPSLRQRIYIIDDTIQFMKGEVTTIQQEIQNISTKQKSTAQQWVIFLKLLLNSNYYLSNGMDTILRELKKVKVTFTREDLISDILDDNAKSYVLKYYQSFDQAPHSFSATNNSTKNFGRSKVYNKSNIEMSSLIKDSNLKEIYSNTRMAMKNLLKRSSFRKSPVINDKNVVFPQIQKTKQLGQNSSRSNTVESENQKAKELYTLWEEKMQKLKKQQLNRINNKYLGNGEQLQRKGKLIKRILFGFNVK